MDVRRFGWVAAVAMVACSSPDEAPLDMDAGSQRDASFDAPTLPDARAPMDGGLDAFAPMDAGFDAFAPMDAGFDASAPMDAGFDAFAPMDAGFDAFAPMDAGFDAFAPTDAGFDAFVPMDAGFDAFAPMDAGFDAFAPMDAGFDASLDSCAPSPEICNGLDDDCNPATADGSADPVVGTLCDSGGDVDLCLEGTWSCAGGLVCSDPATDETTNDVDNCGACGVACANPHGTRSCTAGVCTPSCTSGWFACGAPALGCASLRSTGSVCPGTDLGPIDGDGTGGGDSGSNAFHREGFTDARYFFRVRDVGDCFNDALGVRITLTNPPGVRFGVCSRCFDCGVGGAERCIMPSAGASGFIYVQSFENCTADDSHFQIARIFYISGGGSSCGDWQLDIQGNQETDHDRTCGGDI